MPNSVSLHRILKASPDKVFRAFTDAAAIASWLPPYGFVCTVQELNARQGGTFRMSFINFSTGNGHSFGGTYLEFKPGEFLKYSDKFDDPNLPGEKLIQEGKATAASPGRADDFSWPPKSQPATAAVESDPTPATP